MGLFWRGAPLRATRTPRFQCAVLDFAPLGYLPCTLLGAPGSALRPGVCISAESALSESAGRVPTREMARPLTSEGPLIDRRAALGTARSSQAPQLAGVPR